MKTIGICKTFRGREFALSSLDSVYNHIDKMIYVHGETDWLGRSGNNVRELVEATSDPDKKLLHLSSPAKSTQAQQYDVAVDHILRTGMEFDYIFLSDTDEVMNEENWRYLEPILEVNSTSKTPVLAYSCMLQTYIKSPFYRIEPLVSLCPILFIHRAAIKPGIIGIRGTTLTKGSRLLEKVWIHHFCSVRASLDEVWAKHETSCGSEAEPLCDKEQWVNSIWNLLPGARNCLPLKKHTHLWAGIRVIGIKDLPAAVHKNPIVIAWQKYMGILPSGTIRQITPADLVKAQLPPDFGPGHPLYRFASFRARYLNLLNPPPDTPPVTQVMPAPETRPVAPLEIKPAVAPGRAIKPKTPGSLCVTTIVSGVYQWYIPLFLYCLKKSIPTATPLIYTRGHCILPDLWKGLCIEIPDEYSGNGTATAALRFCYSDPQIEAFDFVHITDIDILIKPETIAMVDQHVRTMQKYNLGCYDNYVSTNSTTAKKVPGVHFVTKEWWSRTAAAREKYRKVLKDPGAPSWDFDELMLYCIISESGLQEPPKLPNLWSHHGVHLGDWRRQIEQKRLSKNRMQADNYVFVQSLMADRTFVDIMKACSVQLPVIGKIFERFQRLFYL
jgi:hypothetical protein